MSITGQSQEIVQKYLEKYATQTEQLEAPVKWEEIINKQEIPMIEDAVHSGEESLDYIIYMLSPELIKRGLKMGSTETIVITPSSDTRRPFGAELIFPQHKPGTEEPNQDTTILRLTDHKGSYDYTAFNIYDIPEQVEGETSDAFIAQLERIARSSKLGKVMLQLNPDGSPVLPNKRDLSGDDPVIAETPAKKLRTIAQSKIDTLKDPKFDTLAGYSNQERINRATQSIKDELNTFYNLIMYLEQNDLA